MEILLLLPLLGLGSAPDTLRVSIAPEQTGVLLPVLLKADGEVGRLVGGEEGRALQAWGQSVPLPDGGRALVYLLPPAAEAGTQVWRHEAAGVAPDPFRLVERDDGRLEITEEGRPVAAYNFGPQLKEGVPEQYRRADYFHPIYDLDGVMISDDFPADHHHHRGLCWSWPEVKVGEQVYDPWACSGIDHRFERWLARETGPVCAALGMECGWYLGDRKVVRETVWSWIYRAGETGRVMDVWVTLEAEADPIPLRGRTPDKGYGGFTFRLAPRRDAAIVTSEGAQPEDAVHVRYRWADYSARFGDGDAVSGVAIFDHPENPDHPTNWMLRYYGVLNPEWPALEWATLERGRPVTLRYRVWIHRGDAQEGKVANAWAAFAKPGVEE